MIFFEQTKYKHMAEISCKMCFLFQMSVLKFVVAYVVKVDFSVGKSYTNTIQPNKSVNPFSFEEESLSFIWQVSSCSDFNSRGWVRKAWKMGFIMEILTDP